MGNLQVQVVNLELVMERTREEKQKIEGDSRLLRRLVDSINAHAEIPEVS